MHYKYIVYQTNGPNGTTINHRQPDEGNIIKLGEIGEYTFIHSDTELDLTIQPNEIQIQIVTLTEDQIVDLKQQRSLSNIKKFVRQDIRNKKGLEDDFVDTKQVIQWLAYAVVDIYSVLSVTQKSNLSHGDNIAACAQMLMNPESKLRVDVEPNQLAKISSVFADEMVFADIVKTRYLDKL